MRPRLYPETHSNKNKNNALDGNALGGKSNRNGGLRSKFDVAGDGTDYDQSSVLGEASVRVKTLQVITGENRKFKKLQIIPRFYYVSTRKSRSFSSLLNFLELSGLVEFLPQG